MAEVKKARLFLRRGTDTDRKTTTLCEGELGYSTDAFRVFVGDGETAGGNPLGMMAFVSAGKDFQTDLTEASAAGLALSGDIAVFPSSDYQGGTVSTIKPEHATTVMLLTGSNPGTASHWVNINNNIPFGNISVSANDITGDYVSGGVITSPITISGGAVNIGGDGEAENLVLSGVALSAHTSINTTNWSADELVYPLGLTSTAQVTCVNSILDFGARDTGGLGNNGGYIHANSSGSLAISAYARSNGAYTIGSTAVGNTSGGTSGTAYKNGASGTYLLSFSEYQKSGGAYANGSGTVLIPDATQWSYTSGLGGRCGIFEVVFDEDSFQEATGAGSLNFNNIREFYFSVFYTHYDDSAAFVGYHNHRTKSNQIVGWNGSSIRKGKMRQVPDTENITIPNTYSSGDDDHLKCLVLHLGIAPYGKLAVVFTGLRVNI